MLLDQGIVARFEAEGAQARSIAAARSKLLRKLNHWLRPELVRLLSETRAHPGNPGRGHFG